MSLPGDRGYPVCVKDVLGWQSMASIFIYMDEMCEKKLLTEGKSACKVHNGIKDETGRFDVGAWVLSL